MNRWFTTAAAVTLLVAATSIIVGFTWLPFTQSDSPFRGVWDAICGAAGLIRNRMKV